MYPFTFSKTDNVYSLLLSNNMKWNIFEKAGFMGSGHDWNRLIEALIREQSPEILSYLNFDSEADMFCVYSENLESLQTISKLVEKFYDDDKLMEEAVVKYAQYR